MKIAVLAFFLTGFVCKSGNAVKETSQTSAPGSGNDTTVIPAPNQQAAANPAPSRQNDGGPTALKANATRVQGSITKIDLVDSLNFRLVIHIDSAFTMGDMPSLVDAGQEIAATPRFIRDANGFAEMSNDRNKRLSRLRGKSPGSPFAGKVSMQSPGLWVIMDTDSL